MSGVRRDGPRHLVLAHSTVRSASFEERVKAAAHAGFAGIGLAARGYAHLRAAGHSDGDLRAVLDTHGIRLTETEGLLGFSSRGEVAEGVLRGRRYADPEVEAQVFAMADAFGVRHVNVGGALEGRLEPDAAEAFAALCDRAAEHDLLVALEPLPCSTVPDLRTAARIVAEAGRPNGGLCLDSWHFFRGSDDEDSLRALPGHRIFVLQLDDGPTLPRASDYLFDTMHNRQLPGHGEFDLVRFVALVDATGARVPVSVEVLSDELDRYSPADAAGLAAAATRSLLDRVRAAPLDG